MHSLQNVSSRFHVPFLKNDSPFRDSITRIKYVAFNTSNAFLSRSLASAYISLRNLLQILISIAKSYSYQEQFHDSRLLTLSGKVPVSAIFRMHGLSRRLTAAKLSEKFKETAALM